LIKRLTVPILFLSCFFVKCRFIKERALIDFYLLSLCGSRHFRRKYTDQLIDSSSDPGKQKVSEDLTTEISGDTGTDLVEAIFSLCQADNSGPSYIGEIGDKTSPIVIKVADQYSQVLRSQGCNR